MIVVFDPIAEREYRDAFEYYEPRKRGSVKSSVEQCGKPLRSSSGIRRLARKSGLESARSSAAISVQADLLGDR